MDPKARSSPGLKVTIKNSATDRSAPAVTIQNFTEAKDAAAAGRVASSGGFKPGGPAAAGSISGKSAHKINERFITDPGAAQRSEERKRSGDSSGGMVARRKLGKISLFSCNEKGTKG